jgi:hypothetical protein
MAVVHLVIGSFGRELKYDSSAPNCSSKLPAKMISAVVNFFFLYNVIYDMRKGDEALSKPTSNAHFLFFDMRKERENEKENKLSIFTYHRHWQQQQRRLHPHHH